MKPVSRQHIAFAAVALVAALAAGCSSGGGGGAPKPVVANPPPPPPPPPPATNFRTAEYNADPGLEQVNVVPAYEAGATGSGVIVSIIDTGIDVNNPEFQDRIDPRSADLVVAGVVPPSEQRAASLQDIDGHGTSVASIIGAAKNNLGIHGVAPQARLLVFRGDKEGDSNTILGEAIAEGVERSATYGAKVMNLSLGSDEAGAEDDFKFIFDFTSDNDIFVAVAAGNDGLANPEPSARAATSAEAAGAVIIVGAVTFGGNIASFSNRAGTGAQFYLVAPGVNVPTTNNSGAASPTVTFSGTSASTPFVAGAAALIRELWPALTASEVADILLKSATDLGAPGVDPIYGHGLLNIGAAIQPLGGASTASVSGGSMEASTMSFAGGGAFDVSGLDLGDYVFLDGYRRDFRASLNGLVSRAPDLRFNPASFLRPNEDISTASRPAGAGFAMFRLTQADADLLDPMANIRASAWSDPFDAERYEYRFSAALAQPVGGGVDLVAAQGFSPRDVDAFLLGAEPIRTLGRDGFVDAYLSASEDAFSTALHWRAGRRLSFQLVAAYADGGEAYAEHLIDGYRDLLAEPAQTNLRLGATYALRSGVLQFETGLRREEGGLLGARIGGTFGDNIASTTWYHAAALDVALAAGWRAAGRYAVGFTATDADGSTGVLAGAEGLVSSQFAVGAYRTSVFAADDRIRLSVSQPLRVESGALKLIAPVRYDYLTGAFDFDERRVGLGEGPREIDFEAGYAFGGALGGALEANLLHQMNATPQGGAATAAIVRAGWDF